MRLTFRSIFSRTLEMHGGCNAFAFVGEPPKTYNDVAKETDAIIAFLEKLEVCPGDRVAILALNSPNWGSAFFAVTFMGAVAVPILPDFSSTEIANVLSHSGAKAAFVSGQLLNRLDDYHGDDLKSIINIDDYSLCGNGRGACAFSPEAVPMRNYEVGEEDLASIIYTSGTTGRSKGVMLTHRNISSNALKGHTIEKITEKDRFLSVLPLSHAYENTLGLILPVSAGACVYYLRKPPTPSVLLPALAEVKPTMMLSVPLIMEKIYFNKIRPQFTDNLVLRVLYKIPLIRKKLNTLAGKKLLDTFGGELKFFGIGGSKLNRSVEQFLKEAGFPYAVGYGLTETSPLLAGSNARNTILESTGPAIEGVELRINDPDRISGEGEIWARGENVMKGYYRDPELTSQVITPDGWFRTGDLGTFDADSNLYIKGRLKNMIVGASGENIYPEEIESVINNFRFVVESLVIQQKGKLVAYVHLNMEELEKKYHTLKQDVAKQYEEKKDEILAEIKDYVNSKVSKFSQINKVVFQPVPFQKTATLKIKRFLYT